MIFGVVTSRQMFIKNKVIKRSLLHDQYGGNRQSGICSSGKTNIIFIFSGKSGHQYGYVDEWDDQENVFNYTGEGTEGDMKFIRGNKALKDHQTNRKRVFLFFSAKQRSYVKFEAELELMDWNYFDTYDLNKKNRKAIRFSFKRKELVLESDSTLSLNEPHVAYGINSPNITERKGLVTSRVGQGAYRKNILFRWNNQCAVTGFNDPLVLIASHIVAWKDSTSEERLDVNNGILLSPNYDALFDKHLISFENSGKIILSHELTKKAYQKLGITGTEIIVGLTKGNRAYLMRHRALCDWFYFMTFILEVCF